MASRLVSNAVIAVMLIAGISTGCERKGAPLAIGERLPPGTLLQTSSGFELVWIVRASDCFSCNTPVYALRQLQQQDTLDTKLTILLVDGDTAVVRSLMARERINGRLQYIESASPTRELIYRRLAIPSLVALAHGKVAGVWTTPSTLRLIQADTLARRLREGTTMY
jgi:hypothetical protein